MRAALPTAKSKPPGLWPATGDYRFYDELLYYAMASDKVRNDSYRRAIKQLVAGKTAVDIGTGGDTVLARMCIEAGARKVYAIEVEDHAFRQASRTLQKARLTDRITLIHGSSFEVGLPEKVDVCVSELIGPIGSSEGASAILNNARRFLKADGAFIPGRVFTKIAAVSVPAALWEHPSMSDVPAYYTERIFEKAGSPFDLRICIANYPFDEVLSTVGIFEDLDFMAASENGCSQELNLTITKPGLLQGFLLWVCVETVPGDVIDVSTYSGCWSPVFFPAFYPGIPVTANDRICGTGASHIAGNATQPDYSISGEVLRSGCQDLPFTCISAVAETRFRNTPFYQRLFTPEGTPSKDALRTPEGRAKGGVMRGETAAARG